MHVSNHSEIHFFCVQPYISLNGINLHEHSMYIPCTFRNEMYWLMPDKTTLRASSEVIFIKGRLFVGRKSRYVKRIRHFYVAIDANSCISHVLCYIFTILGKMEGWVLLVFRRHMKRKKFLVKALIYLRKC